MKKNGYNKNAALCGIFALCVDIVLKRDESIMVKLVISNSYLQAHISTTISYCQGRN
jgi:branched-subunit amino acid transport protein